MRERGNFWLKLADRCLGIPLLLALSSFRRKGIHARGNVLAIKVGTIGDTLLLLPVLKAIKEAEGVSSLDVVAGRGNFEVLRRYPFIDNVKVFEISKAARNPSYFKAFLAELNGKEYGVVADFEPWPRVTAILSLMVKTGIKVGFDTKGQHRHFAYDIKVPHGNHVHESGNYSSLASAFDIKTEVPLKMLDFPVLDEEKEQVEKALKELGIKEEKLVLIHPWSSGYKGWLKEWGAGNFSALALLLSRDGYTVGITGVKGEAHMSEEIVAGSSGAAVSFCGRFNLGSTAWLIKKSRLLISVNTGIMHLGSIMCTPLIVLDGPAGALRWGPAGAGKSCIIKGDFPCSPCLSLGFEYKCKDGGCMASISIDSVYGKAKEMLGEFSSGSKTKVVSERYK
ncbi:MAG: glycosyltransferase family 9 protein [Deltaproteobacteria bacterium]|nr:glycosyltransferase family 9 protein [Deltaproteobacteria bacterium]